MTSNVRVEVTQHGPCFMLHQFSSSAQLFSTQIHFESTKKIIIFPLIKILRFLPISSSSYFYCNKYSYVMLFLYFLKSLRTLYDTFFGSFKTYINKNFQIFTSFIQIKYMYYNNLHYIYSLFDCYLFQSLYYQYAKYLSFFFNYLKHLNLKYFVYIFNLKATL